MKRKEEIIKKLKDFVEYEEAELLKAELRGIYEKEYVPKRHAAEYLKVIVNHKVSEIEDVHPQNTNDAEYCFRCFSCVSQHVNGYTQYHCYDQVCDAVEAKEAEDNRISLLTTLEELVESDAVVELEEEYEVRIGEGHSRTLKGAEINKMRETSIGEVQFNNMLSFLGVTTEEYIDNFKEYLKGKL